MAKAQLKTQVVTSMLKVDVQGEVELFAFGLHASQIGACNCLPPISNDLEGKKSI